LHTSGHTRKNSSFSTQDEHLGLLGLEALTDGLQPPLRDTLYISALWVDERLRGHGVGTQLLQAAEQAARARGCQHMSLDSYNFQAPGFYQKHGYEVFAVLEDHPRHHRNYYLRKRLT
jgi:ribosomal protein S18 acetylase RimI-like enzyme